VRTLGLKKEAADFVMEAPPQSFTYLTQENTDRVGIAFTRMSIIPAYKPLP
jgi:hypothetical protein